MSTCDSKTAKPSKSNKPIKFGPYPKYPKDAFTLAHKHGATACSLLYGKKEQMDNLDLSTYSVFTMPPGASCIFFHNRRGNTTCKFRIEQESGKDEAAPADEKQAATMEPASPEQDPPLEPPMPDPNPQQICLCPDGEYTCGPEDTPDCGEQFCQPSAKLAEEKPT